MKFDRLINPNDISKYSAEISTVADYCIQNGKKVHVLIEPERKPRTVGEKSQSNHLNGHIQQICQETGNDFDDVKKFVKQEAVSMGYPILKKFGRDVMDLWGNPVGISEADADTKQCAILIDVVHRLASELGIILRESELDY